MPFADVQLSDGHFMPAIAFGSGSVNKHRDIHEYIENALEQGFSHLDTAQFYGNEESVGLAIRESGLSRSDVFVTTKWAGNPNVRESLEASLSKLGLEYVDLFLIHNPLFSRGNIEHVWQQFEQVREAGLTRSIGVSNFAIEDLQQLLKVARLKPVVNQIQFHPYNWTRNKDLLEFHVKHGITTEGYSSLTPITRYPGGPVDAALAQAAKRINATPTQVIFSWVKAKRVVIITTTSKLQRLKEYLAVGDLPDLTPQEIAAIDHAGSAGPPSVFSFKSITTRVLNERWRIWPLLFALLTLVFYVTHRSSRARTAI